MLRSAAGDSAGSTIIFSLVRAFILATIVGALIMFGLPAVLAMGAAASI